MLPLMLTNGKEAMTQGLHINVLYVYEYKNTFVTVRWFIVMILRHRQYYCNVFSFKFITQWLFKVDLNNEWKIF